MQNAILIARQQARISELTRCQNDLYYLCSEVLGYSWSEQHQQGMTADFHLPLCKRMDRLREHPRLGNWWARWHLKTTILTVGLAIQEILRNPDITIFIAHAVEDEVIKIISELVEHFKANKRLRALRPEIMPHHKQVRWFKTNQFTVKRERFNRQPTVLGTSAGSEITGAHVDLILLDDIIGRRTIEDSQLPKVASWYRNTVLPVLNPGGRIRCVGTRWDVADIYGTWIDSPEWDTVVRAALETDGVPDYKGTPVLYGPPGGLEAATERIELLRTEMGPDFSAQMMNDPSPAGEKPWAASQCEHFIDLREASGPGTIFVLSDPAPAKVGSMTGRGEQDRRDGTKDCWANAVIKVRSNGQRQELILLDGTFSREWGPDDGWEEVMRLAKKWGTAFVAPERAGSAAFYDNDLHKAARKVGASCMLVKLANTYKGKNYQFAQLADRAKRREFLIASTCPADFVEKFLAQARMWRPLTGNKNSLRFDDEANCVSFATDPALQEYAPQAVVTTPFDELEEEMSGSIYRSRYCVA